MGPIGVRRTLAGAALVVAIAGASATLVLFNGGNGTRTSGRDSAISTDTTRRPVSSTTTTSTTTTTLAPAPVADPAPAPVAPEPAPEPPPAPVVFSPPSCDGGGGGVAGAVIAAMNADRGGLGSLCWNNQLAGIAQGWANWMAANQSLSHQDLQSVLGGTSFSTIGENLLVGPVGMSVGEMEAMWMASSGHRANILGPYTAAAVGVATDGNGQWWVAVEFGG
jgi:uncharacterized protein YkwD